MATADRIAIYALTRPAAELALRLEEAFISSQRSSFHPEPGTRNGERGTRQADLYLPADLTQEFGGQGFSRLQDLVAETFHRYMGHVFLTAAGIAVRSIATLLQGKDRDPAVVVLDQKGEYAVSLLSGHLGRGNRLAREVAAILGGRAVITTATDSLGLPAVEELAR
ncbi:MAG: cobalamin biosynthesis protein CbiG, partial [Desulfohalobiaceae bacterium]|nr:cobalamin biosynthesis protein CbiG [Desulfohalobiaceae bacterium]